MLAHRDRRSGDSGHTRFVAPRATGVAPMSASNPGKTTDAERVTDRVVIFDTTLRDGEQSPGASMNLEEKIRIALQLEEMGVDVIEAGFPIASNGDFDAVRGDAKHVQNSTPPGLSRPVPMAIYRAS